MRPLVSIILVNYNGYQDTVDCVKSLEKIDYENFEIIVVDNGSTVTPTEEQRRYLNEHTSFISSDRNLGFSGGNNLGMKYAKEHNPQYYLLLNNDTEVEVDFLSVLVDEAENHLDAGIACGKIRWFDYPDRIWYAGGAFDSINGKTTHYKYDEIDSDCEKWVKEVSFATGCLWLLPVKVTSKIGLMDERMFLYAEDTEYSCRLIQNGYKIYYCNHSVIYHKVSRSTGMASDSTQYYMVRNNLMIIRMYGEKKLLAYKNRLYYWCKEVLRGRMKCRPVVKGIVDFIRHIDGQVERK